MVEQVHNGQQLDCPKRVRYIIHTFQELSDRNIKYAFFSRLLCIQCPTTEKGWIFPEEGASSFSSAPEVVMGIGIMILKPSKEESEEWQKVRQGRRGE